MLLAATVAAFALILGFGIGTGLLLRLAERPDGSTGIDSSITAWFIAHRTGALTSLARALSTLGSQVVLLPLTAVAAAMLILRRRFAFCALVIAAWGGAILLYSVTKQVVGRHRPPAHLWLTVVGRTPSFPSGHATQSLATLAALAVLSSVWLPRAGPAAKLLALALIAGVGWSRVYLGVHWATDVAAGWLVAAAWIIVLLRLIPAFRQSDDAPMPEESRLDGPSL